MKVIIEKHLALMEIGDPRELRWIETIQTAEIVHYYSDIN